MTLFIRRTRLLIALCAAAASIGSAQMSIIKPPNIAGAPATFINGVDAILSAFDRHRIVAVSDLHGCVEEYDFYMKLVGDPRFPNVVNDVVLEMNSSYQFLVDRFIAGDAVSDDVIREV